MFNQDCPANAISNMLWSIDISLYKKQQQKTNEYVYSHSTECFLNSGCSEGSTKTITRQDNTEIVVNK